MASIQAGKPIFGNINDMGEYNNNLYDNCIPKDISTMTAADYDRFLMLRRKMMADKIKKYYYQL